MPAVSIPKLITDDREINQLQNNIIAALNTLVTGSVLDGQIIERVILVSGTNVIKHGLGRKLIGWFFVRKRATGDVYDSQDTNTTPQNTLQLVSPGSLTVDLYVF